MLTTKKFYKEENMKILKAYKDGIKRIEEICSYTKEFMESKELKHIYNFFNRTCKFILRLDEIEGLFNEEYFSSKSFDELKNENYKLYEELQVCNYNKSYANPNYAVEVLGEEIGLLFSSFYVMIREGIRHALRNRLFKLHENNEIFIEAFDSIKKKGTDYTVLKSIMIKPFLNRESLIRDEKYFNEECLNENFKFYSDTVLNTNLSDLRYLFRYDNYISINEIKMAQFLNSYPSHKLEKLSKAIVIAFLRGFISDNKTRGDRNVVRLIYSVGQERIIKYLVEAFKEKGFNCVFQLAQSTNPNKQYEYDHRFDNALYLDKSYVQLKEETYAIAYKETEHHFSRLSGPVIIESFGEIPFSPENKREYLELSEKQEELSQSLGNKLNEIYYRYEPKNNTNYCLLALPNPEIGDNFEDIFEETLKINMMDNSVYESIQQKLIDVLDGGEFVHIVGKDGNESDIKVRLQEIHDPNMQSNFVNMVSESNMPLGEVYTTPKLKGTSGILHIKDVYLEGFKYKNLKLIFKDGYVVDYGCSNFEDENDNKKYVYENLMDLQDNIPLSEFAIGTNTEAYVMAKKYGILELLPLLIVEKMGPHFAIGDTCYFWNEDTPVYNLLNGKEIISRDNERSILRRENIDIAYVGFHTDITLTYEEIAFISVIRKDGTKTDIIRDGRFVLEGTEDLNNPFKDI